MAEDISLTPSQKKQKDLWLFVTILKVFVVPILIILPVQYLIMYRHPGEELTAFLELLTITGAISLLGIVSLYVCAYKGHGNKWLMFVAIASLVGAFRETKLFFSQSWDTSNIAIFISTTCLCIWWFVLCVKLTELNSHLQLQNYLNSSQYNLAVTSFHQAKDLQDLETKYKQAIKGAPRKYSKLLAEPYEKMKLQLSPDILTSKTTKVTL